MPPKCVIRTRKRSVALECPDHRLPLVNHRRLLIFACSLLFAGSLIAKRQNLPGMAPNARLYIAPMEWGLDRFVADQILRDGLPVQLVSKEDQADLVMTSLYQKLGSHLIAPGHYIQVRIVAANDGRAVWSDEVNDFAIVFGRLRRHGPRKAAEAIVKKLRNQFAAIH